MKASSSRRGAKWSWLRRRPLMIRESRITMARACSGIDADQGGNRVQRIEEKVRIDLAGEGFEARLNQQPFLLFELDFVARVVPDLERERDAEISGGVNGGEQKRRIAPARDGEQFSVEETCPAPGAEIR